MTNPLAKIGFDHNGLIAVAGIWLASHWTGLMAGITATATAAYMVHRAWREWKKK